MDKDDLKYNEDSYGGLQVKKSKIKKVKQQCNSCGHIDYTLKCTKCGGAMFKYINTLGK